MKSVLYLFFMPLILLLLINSVSAQEITNGTMKSDFYFGNNTADRNDLSRLKNQKKKSSHQINLERQIIDLKKQDYPENRKLIEELNVQLEKISENSSTKLLPNNGGTMRYVNSPLETHLTDDITNIRLYNNTAREIKGMATCTEQTGANAGKIWVFYNFSANTTSPDSFKFVYSTNGGSSWITYITGNIRPLDKVNYDDLDMELIEGTSGSKYLMVVYGQRANGGTGKWFTGGLVINITSFNGSFFDLAWPGNDSTKRYYNIRITTDNASYANTAYLYLVCSFDSLNTNNTRINSQKYARCLNPYTASPSFTYQGENFWWLSSSGPANYERNLFSDIAYFKNGTGDSVIVSFSNVPDSTRIYFAKADINGNPSAGNGAALQTGSEVLAQKQWARLSTNGNGNGSVICVFREFANNNWYVKYFRTTNFGDFSAISQSLLLGSEVNTNYQPDIVGKRNGDSYYFTFNTISTTDSVHNYKITSSGTETHIQRVNFASPVSDLQGPKPGIRYADNDSCFTLYTETGPHNIWAALGCSGEPIGIKPNNNNAPQTFALHQNFPNPFNPSTSIRFDVPKEELVKLVVYDILGREIAILVNNIKTSGSYIVNFDASNHPSGVYFYKITADNFTDSKKMLLMK